MKNLIRLLLFPLKPFFMKVKLYLPLYMYYIYFYITIRFIIRNILHIKRIKNIQTRVLKCYSGNFNYEIENYLKNVDTYVTRYGQPQIEGTRDVINNRYNILRYEVAKISHESILEVGCGVGLNIELLTADFKESFVVGFDYSFDRVSIAKRYTKTNSGILNASAINIPFKDKSFDILITQHVLEQLKYDIDSVLQEMKRVTKSYIILIEPFVEFMEIFHKMYHYANDYPRIKNKVEKYFEIEKFYSIPFGRFVQISGVLVGKKKDIYF